MSDKETLKNIILVWRDKRYTEQKCWSFAHHFSMFGSIISSIFAGVVIQSAENPVFATFLTSVAAVLTGIASSGGFERKWRSNRLGRSAADRLLLDLDCGETDLILIKDQYKALIEKHDFEIVGEPNNNSKQPTG